MDANATETTATPAWRSDTVERIDRVLSQLNGDRIRLQRLGSAFGPSAVPLLLVLIVTPFALPVGVPGSSAIASLPMFALLVMLAGNRPRVAFPRRIGRAWVPWRPVRQVLPTLDRILATIERMSRPRWPRLVEGRWRLAMIVTMALMVVLIAAPFPTGNVPSAAAIIVFSIAILRQDGAMAAVGYGLATLALAWNGAVAAAFLLLGTEAFSLLPF
jgi:hypothetical protein